MLLYNSQSSWTKELNKKSFQNVIYLVESIIQTLVQVVKVEEDNSLASLHAHLDAVDVAANLCTVSERLVKQLSDKSHLENKIKHMSFNFCPNQTIAQTNYIFLGARGEAPCLF